jgi:hypothetical protein
VRTWRDLSKWRPPDNELTVSETCEVSEIGGAVVELTDYHLAIDVRKLASKVCSEPPPIQLLSGPDDSWLVVVVVVG